MGNCQAIDTATLVIQYPSGKSEKLYWPVSASEIMKSNPGHYVALLISTTLCPNNNNTSLSNNNNNDRNDLVNNNTISNNNNNGAVRLTRIKLLRPTDTLVLGQVYRLIATQEVMKGLWAKKQAKLKKGQSEGGVRVEIVRGSDHHQQLEKDNKVNKQERHKSSRTTTTSTNSSSTSSSSSAMAKPRIWQPSLHSISEATS